MADHNILGAAGEDLAIKYLEEKGFEILHKNWRDRNLEIDIIATFNRRLHFVEVKTRRTKKYGLPDEAVSKKKLKYLIEAADRYLLLNPGNAQIQFDIVSILLLKNKPPEYFFINDVYTN